MLSTLRSDLHQACRTLTRRPGFTLLAVLTLAVGMSVNTVAFSVANAVLFKRPAVVGIDRLGWLFRATADNPWGDWSLPEYDALRAGVRGLEAVVAEGRLPLRVRNREGSDQVWSLAVSADYFQVLGVRPEQGRLFASSDRDQLVAVVSHAFWVDRLGGAPVGQTTVMVNDRACLVVGVLSPGFQGPGGLYVPDLVVPLEARVALGLPEEFGSASSHWLMLEGRLAAHATPAQVDAELSSLVSRIGSEPASSPRTWRARYAPMADGHPEVRSLSIVAAIGMGAVAVVLLIACFNVAGLLVARAVERRREMAIRAAIGATAGRLLRQLASEGLVFAALAGAASFALSAASGRLLTAFSLPAPIPQQIDLSPDGRTVVFTLVMVVVAGLLPSLLPASLVVRLDLQAVLAGESGTVSGSGARARGRRLFQIAQIAGATAFLALAVLFASSLQYRVTSDPGFDTRGVLVVSADPRAHGLSVERAEAFFRTLADRLSGDSRVRAASVTSGIPYTVGTARAAALGVDGRDCRVARCEPIELFAIDAAYLKAMRITLVTGRNLTDADRRVGGGVLVSRTTAERFWAGRNPIGSTVMLGSSGELAEVVGIVSDVRSSGLGAPSRPQAYRAMRTADHAGGVVLAVGTDGDPTALLAAVRAEAWRLEPAMPLQSAVSMAEHLRLPLWAPRVAAWFVGACAVVALVLATVGLFGLVLFLVAQRRQEFGIRVALGATPASMVRLVVGEGLALTAVGGVLGLVVAAAAAVLMRGALVGVSAIHPGPYVVVAGLQMAIALLACAWPALRAARADVTATLRAER